MDAPVRFNHILREECFKSELRFPPKDRFLPFRVESVNCENPLLSALISNLEASPDSPEIRSEMSSTFHSLQSLDPASISPNRPESVPGRKWFLENRGS
jgi:hypothetical protein